MKRIKKVTCVVMSSVLVFLAAACSKDKENTPPEITGVKDQAVEAGTTFHAFEGIAASDAEEGDLTAKIVIDSTPKLDFKNGKAVPEQAGSYELTYSVTDKEGAEVKAYSTLTVTKQTSEAVVYRKFDFNTDHAVDAKGWSANVAEGVSASGMIKQGAYVFEIASPGNEDKDIQLLKSGILLEEAEYKVKVWAKSTKNTYAHLIARDENAEEWATFAGAFNLVIGTEIAPLELTFNAKEGDRAQLMLNLGKITPNAENKDDTTPDDFVVTIDKIEIYKISGEETNTPVFTNDFAGGESGVLVSAGDGAVADAKFEDGECRVVIDSYPTQGGVWSIKADIGLPGVTIESGKKYYYSFKMNAANSQSGECLVESAALFDANRVHFNGFSAAAKEECEISGVFTAQQAVADPVIRLQIGNASENVTDNTILIDDVVFGEVEGDLETVKTMDTFMAFGKGSANETNKDYPWSTFNGTDEDNERGVGTIWMEGGSLFYRIDQGSTTDWQNKLTCGYTQNPLVLEADSYYTVEITAKADKEVSCGFFLNPLGGWDPRLSERLELTGEEQTFSFTTTDTFIMDMDFEMLFQFGSEQTAGLDGVTIEISDVTIYRKSVY